MSNYPPVDNATWIMKTLSHEEYPYVMPLVFLTVTAKFNKKLLKDMWYRDHTIYQPKQTLKKHFSNNYLMPMADQNFCHN